MKCLLVIAHPLPGSLCARLAERAEAALRAGGHEVMREDLYASGFDPALSTDERRVYYAPDYPATAVAEQVARLRATEAIVLVFPTWWFAFPAMLKGWFDRVWAARHRLRSRRRPGCHPAASGQPASGTGRHHPGRARLGRLADHASSGEAGSQDRHPRYLRTARPLRDAVLLQRRKSHAHIRRSLRRQYRAYLARVALKPIPQFG